jgi:hypothetical protein
VSRLNVDAFRASRVLEVSLNLSGWNFRFFGLCREPNSNSVVCQLGNVGSRSGNHMAISREYLAQHAAALLQLSKLAQDPELALALLTRAADLKSRLDEQRTPDRSPRAPDVQNLA